MFAFLIHIYYEESWDKIFKSKLEAIREQEFLLLINICMEMPRKDEVIQKIKEEFPSAFVITTPNIGKDIGGKLALIDLFLHLDLQAEYLVFLHDKKSPHTSTGDIWRTTLMKIMEPPVIKEIMTMLSRDKKIGVVGSKEFIMDEYHPDNVNRNNGVMLSVISKKYGLDTMDHRFVAGTMFWIRSKIFRDFFTAFPALECRKNLETGNVLDHEQGSVTHCWERLFGWIASANGYKIKGA